MIKMIRVIQEFLKILALELTSNSLMEEMKKQQTSKGSETVELEIDMDRIVIDLVLIRARIAKMETTEVIKMHLQVLTEIEE